MRIDQAKCETGCVAFFGGEIRHDKNCAFYPDSRTEMYDKAITELTNLQTLLASAGVIAFQDGTSLHRDGDRWRFCRDEVESESDFGSVVEAWEGLREEK